jgi:Cu+-exporting ATPase
MPDQQETTFKVTGMSCGKCAARVERALRGVNGVSEASVDLSAAKARVTSAGVEPAALEAAVRDAGYECERV